MTLKERVTEDMKAALKAKDAAKLSAIRLLLAAIKQREVDERMAMDDVQVIGIIEKMLKQRRESIGHYEAAGRTDLVLVEQFEISVLNVYLPQAYTAEEVEELLTQAIADTNASTIKDMGKVMAILKPQLAGRADIAQVSASIKAKLSG